MNLAGRLFLSDSLKLRNLGEGDFFLNDLETSEGTPDCFPSTVKIPLDEL